MFDYRLLPKGIISNINNRTFSLKKNNPANFVII